jgi:hypothetical protein
MPDLEDEERCIAITGSGDRCSRVAKDGRFCFQHDESYETVEIQTAESAGIVNWLSSELESRAAQASDIQRDVYMNLADMQSGLENAIDDFRSGDTSLDTLLDRFVETAEEVGGDRSRNTAAGAFIGGIAGAPLGPAGIYAGIVAGSSVSFFMTPKDERTIIAIPVDEIPDDAEVVPSNHPAIDPVSPIQLVVESASDGEDEDWVRETNTRSWDMDEVESALGDLPEYDADDSPPGGYYIRDVETGRVVVVIFGIPDDDFPTS